MIILYIILAHLIADFLLQPQKLVDFKEKSFFGVLAHSLIHLAVTGLILLPYINNSNIIFAVLVLFILHMIIDQAKISLQIKTDRYFQPFLIDQFLHLFTIFSIYNFFELDNLKTASQSLYFNRGTPILFIILVFFIAVYDIAHFQLRREKQKNISYSFKTKNLGVKILLAFLVFLGFSLFGYFLG